MNLARAARWVAQDCAPNSCSRSVRGDRCSCATPEEHRPHKDRLKLASSMSWRYLALLWQLLLLDLTFYVLRESDEGLPIQILPCSG